MRALEKTKLFDLFVLALVKAERSVRLKVLKNGNQKQMQEFAASAFYDIYTTLSRYNLPTKYKKTVDKAWKKIRPDVIKRLERLGLDPIKTYKGNDVVNYIKKWGGLQVDYLTRKYANEIYISAIQAAYSVDFEDAIAELEKVLPMLKKRYAKTLIETSWRSMEAQYTINQAEKLGVKRYRYDGPVDEKNRSFCAAHVGKVYTIDEIKQMVNDFGQSAWIYRGGWNCRHYWTPVLE